jgi:hypothetical protein
MYMQERRKHQKIGGGDGFGRNFWNEKGTCKIFPEILATGGGGGGGGNCNHTTCNLNNIFDEGKKHFATGETWAFFVFYEGKIIACNHKKTAISTTFFTKA